jgi:hypothetical protein
MSQIRDPSNIRKSPTKKPAIVIPQNTAGHRQISLLANGYGSLSGDQFFDRPGGANQGN